MGFEPVIENDRMIKMIVREYIFHLGVPGVLYAKHATRKGIRHPHRGPTRGPVLIRDRPTALEARLTIGILSECPRTYVACYKCCCESVKSLEKSIICTLDYQEEISVGQIYVQRTEQCKK